jgi:hypothetical protein
VPLPVIDARTRRAALRILVMLACAALPLAIGCGKKGPPLAPLSRLPVAPQQVSASRAANHVTIRFTVPAANVSGIRPADIERVDVYAWTGPDVPAARVFKVAKVVASVPVRTPPPPPEDGGTAAPPPPVGPGIDQGAAAQLHETLAADAFLPIEVPDRKKVPVPVREPKVTPPDAAPLPPPLTRRYVVVGVNHGGRRGPGAAVAVPLWTPPPPPLGVTVKALEGGIELTWTAPGHLRRPVMANALPPAARPAPATRRGAAPRPAVRAPTRDDDDDEKTEDGSGEDAEPPAVINAEPPEVTKAEPPAASEAEPSGVTSEPPAPARESPAATPAPPRAAGTALLPARLAVPWPAVAIGYHIYETSPATARAAVNAPAGGSAASAAAPELPRRLTTAPLRATTFSDTRVEYGVERCYIVRTIETIGTLSVESAGSEPVCVKTTDVFPPAPPKSLGAVASDGAISLIWEGSSETDLAGYIVLRGVAPGRPAERLTPQPIRETTFRDTRVKPGTRYVYAVIAVDTAKPPNASAPSNQVEETAR